MPCTRYLMLITLTMLATNALAAPLSSPYISASTSYSLQPTKSFDYVAHARLLPNCQYQLLSVVIAQAYAPLIAHWQDFNQKQEHLASLKPAARMDILWKPHNFKDVRQNRLLTKVKQLEERLKARDEARNFINNLENVPVNVP